MDERSRRLGPLATALLLLLLLLARGPLARDVPPLDGTFVGARLAAHAAAGVGPLYNPGAALPQPAHPIESPLVVALATSAALLHLPPLESTLLLALLAELAAAALLLHLLRERPRVAAGAVILLAATPELGQVGAGGGAGPLALAGILAACAAARVGRPVMTGALAGLATAAAPEAALVLPGIWLFRREGHRRVLVEGAGFVAVVALACMTLVQATGDWRPAPLTSPPLHWGPAVPGMGTPLLLVLLGLGLARRDAAAAALRPLLLVGAVTAIPWLVLGRSLDPRAAYLPLAAVAVLGAVGLEPLLARLGDRAAALAGVGAVALGVLALPRTEPGLRAGVWEPLAAWSEEAGVRGGGERLLASDLGFTGWYAGGVVEACAPDPLGLVGQLLTLKPKYLLLRTARPELMALRSHGDLARAWYPIERFSVDGETALDPELGNLPEEVEGDYLLFLRRL